MRNPKTAADLEWLKVEQAVLNRCVGPLALKGEVPIASTAETAARALTEAAEALDMLRNQEPLPLDGLCDLETHMDRTERLGVLDTASLRDVATTLGAARRLRRYLQRHRARLPALVAACGIDPSLDDVQDAISNAIGPDGRLKDNASDALQALRNEVAALRSRIVRRLEALLVKHEAIVQDSFFTIREGRYVIPIRRDAHEKLPGIVHGTSASGASVFVEPSQFVEQGNRLKMAQSEMQREEARILAALTELVRERLPEMRAAYDSLNHADLRSAAARFGVDTEAEILPLLPEQKIDLLDARHPLLILEGGDVVPSSMRIGAGEGVIISGPNAGGKTVALKLLGLVAVMMRAGLPVNAGAGSGCGFFEKVLTDIGDDQSIARNLSTFSAHVVNLRHVLQEAGKGSLVLLDELAGSTDPGEGSALAAAIVEELIHAQATVVATTHYDRLKALAAEHPCLNNASVGFDAKMMLPTFQLLFGVPGPSSALMVATRYGLPENVLRRAQELVPRDTADFQSLVEELLYEKTAAQSERDENRAEAQRLQGERTKLEQAETKLKAERQDLRKGAGDALARETQEVERALKRLRKDLRNSPQTQAQLQAGEASLRDARTALRSARAQEHTAPPAPDQERAARTSPDINPGASVWLPRLQKHGTVIERRGPERIRVAVGPVKLIVAASEAQSPRAQISEKPPAAPSAPKTAQAPTHDVVLRTSRNTVDLRGMRADEALTCVETFLDRAFGRDDGVVFLLHGHGTGALKKAVRDWLRAGVSYVSHYRPAAREEGGDAYTVVFVA